MSDRFYSSQPITSDRATLDGPEAHHLLHVMRAAVGASVTLFDGSGTEFMAVVEAVRRAEAVVRIVERVEVDRELPVPLVFGVSLPKGDRQKWLVEKLTELGVTELVPLVVERGVAQPTESAIERLNRSVIEAAKQCGRNRLLQLGTPQVWKEWISNERIGLRLLAHPTGQHLAQIDLREIVTTQVSIGPEGGFTDAEVAAAEGAGWSMVSLGPRILRVETAAIALAAAITLRQP